MRVFKVTKTKRKAHGLHFVVGMCFLMGPLGLGFGSSSAQQVAARADLRDSSSQKPAISSAVATAVVAPSAPSSAANVKPVRKPGVAAKGPYYVDFRARTAASYG